MTRSAIARYLNPWKFKREQQLQRVDSLRRRDGDNCRRCRRPMRFDLPLGHDKAPMVVDLVPSAKGEALGLNQLCLCHGRCKRDAADSTGEVLERLRIRQGEEAVPD